MLMAGDSASTEPPARFLDRPNTCPGTSVSDPNETREVAHPRDGMRTPEQYGEWRSRPWSSDGG